jgi:hypothetical protein
MELQLDEYVDLPLQVTLDGADVDADALPTFRIYEEGAATIVDSGDAAKLDDANTLGWYRIRSQVTTAKGYEIGKIYSVRATVIVGGVTGSKLIGMFLCVSADVVREDDVLAVDSGANTVTITVDDGTDPLESAKVRVTKGAESYLRSTNALGIVSFNVDDGSWTVAIALLGYDFAGAALVVAGDTPITYSMTQVVMPASDPGLVTGYLYCYDQAGAVEKDVIIELRVFSNVGTGISNDTATRTATSTVAGLVTFINLFCGATYLIRRGPASRHRLWTEFTVPAAATTPYALPDIWGHED